MPVTMPNIPPRRSIALFAVLSVGMAVASYVLIILLAAACIYLPYLVVTNVEHPSSQMALLALGGIAVAGAILWALVPKRDKFEAPGLLLESASHPRLFRELTEIAAALNEPLPAEVYLVGQVNAFVADRGGVLAFGSRRIMGVGLPLLGSLTIPEMRAVLAHEFAHYYGGDTRMGPWTYKTQSAMIRAFQNMGTVSEKFGRIGALQIVNVVVSTVLKWYFLFFLRVSNFLSRKREYRADELACLVAGGEQLVRGLRKIHGAVMAWEPYWNAEVVPVLNQGRMPPIGEGFSLFLAAPQIAEQITGGIETEIAEGKTKPYDTHPPLRDRIAAVEKLGIRPQTESGDLALTLLDEPEAVERRFLESMNPRLATNSLKLVAWNDIGPVVTVPSWKKAVEEYGSLFAGITAERIPDVTKNLQQIGSKIRDPKGQLLTPLQRAQRAGHLLGVALALAMLEQGWELEAQPGSFYLFRGKERINIVSAVGDVISGETSAEQWSKKCAELGITDLALASAADGAAKTG